MDLLIQSAQECERVGAWDQALSFYEQAFAHLPSGGCASRAAELLRWIGTVHRERGELELAEESYEASLAIAELNALGTHVAAGLNCLGIMEHRRGRVHQAEIIYERALEQSLALGDQRLAVMVEQNLGALQSLRGDLGSALAHYQSALNRSEAFGEGLIASRTLNNMGMAHLDLGDWNAAEGCFQRASTLAAAAGDILMMGTLQLNTARLHLRRQHLEEARSCCDRSLELFRQTRSKLWIAEAYKFSGILHREQGCTDRADACFAMSLGMAEVAQNRLLQAEANMEWAVVHLGEGRDEKGIQYLNRALNLFTEMEAHREVLDIRDQLAKVEGLYLSAIHKWSSAQLESLGPRHVDHACRVAETSCALAGALSLSGWDAMVVRVGALIHDIGFTSLPPGGSASASDEQAGSLRFKLHPIAGDAIAKRLEFPAEIRAIVRGHHERMSGAGFPDALPGDVIPITVQIVAVSDVLDQLMYPGPPASRRSLEEAVALMRAEPGAYAPFLLDLLQDQLPRRCAAQAA